MIRNNGIWVFVMLLFWGNPLVSQSNVVTLDFVPAYGLQTFSLEHRDFMPAEVEGVGIETLKFYISNIRFLTEDIVVFEDQTKTHLIDAAQPESTSISFKFPGKMAYSAIQFDLGIDSVTNVSGALGGDLDPTKGMYWSWQSGYINFKLEGYCNDSPARNHAFQFHLGGYLPPYRSVKTMRYAVHPTDQYVFKLDIENMLNEIDISRLNHVMSPGEDALLISSIVANSLTLQKREP